MSNVKISQLPSWTGSSADLRWFVMNNSGENETFKFSGYTSPFKWSGSSNIIVPNISPAGGYATLEITNGTNTIDAGALNNIVVGNTNTITQDKYNIIVGTSNNVTGAGAPGTTGSLVIGTGNNLGTYGYANIVVGAYNSLSNAYNFRLGNNGSTTGSSTLSFGEQVDMGGNYSIGFGAYITNNNDYSFSFGNNNDIINTGSYNGIWGGQNNIVDTSTFSSIINGTNNSIIRATNSSILSSTNSTQNASPSPYSTSNVSMIGCSDTDITNSYNSVVLGVSGRTLTNAVNTTIVDKLYVFGNVTYEATTFNDAGTCNIDIFNMSHVIINATGGTYTLSINPEPSAAGTPEVTLLINVSGGATIAFNNAGNTQWRWGNGAGTPTFTNNTRSIIKMAAWDLNDVYEISRSMNMS